MQNHPQIQLVKRGRERQETFGERRINYSPPAQSFLGEMLPRGLAKEPFVVPVGRLAVPVDMDGTPLTISNRETGEVSTVYPRIRIVEVDGETGAERLIAALYKRLDDQLPAIRERLDGIFRRYFTQGATFESIEKVATQHQAPSELLDRISHDLGLKIEWSMNPEPTTSNWIRTLVGATHPPVSDSLVFNEEFEETALTLTFSVSIEKVHLPNIVVAERRARQNSDAGTEVKRIFERVREMTKSAFRAVVTGVDVWNRELIRELAHDGFASVVSSKIAREFGYVVKFGDFGVELNQALVKSIKSGSLAEMYDARMDLAKKTYLALADKRAQLIAAGSFPAAQRLDESLAKAEEEVKKLAQTRVDSNNHVTERLGESKVGQNQDVHEKFIRALQLEENAESQRKYGRSARN
ncbi:hypothetical protein [Verrucomicrobium sp. BvORR106]|uniref:hypothetical protein n=1 Tax=Verrucomicrobium sp. BvORR106 TaxID=1403819 RepID=UPI00056E8487|nr:hypothetical protein [Verrucomicrobium sp. BvORR106]